MGRTFHRPLLLLLLGAFSQPLTGQTPRYVARHGEPQGRQILAVYIGATDCQPCVWPPFKKAVAAMWPLLEAQADSARAGFATLGVAINEDADSGAAMLAPLSQYDEVSLGGYWVNHVADRYIWNDPHGEAAVPQILVIARDINASEGKSQWSVSNSRVLLRHVGATAVIAWVAAGAHIPGLAADSATAPAAP